MASAVVQTIAFDHMRGDYVRFGVCVCAQVTQMLKMPDGGTEPSVAVVHVADQKVSSVSVWKWSAVPGAFEVGTAPPCMLLHGFGCRNSLTASENFGVCWNWIPRTT